MPGYRASLRLTSPAPGQGPSPQVRARAPSRGGCHRVEPPQAPSSASAPGGERRGPARARNFSLSWASVMGARGSRWRARRAAPACARRAGQAHDRHVFGEGLVLDEVTVPRNAAMRGSGPCASLNWAGPAAPSIRATAMQCCTLNLPSSPLRIGRSTSSGTRGCTLRVDGRDGLGATPGRWRRAHGGVDQGVADDAAGVGLEAVVEDLPGLPRPSVARSRVVPAGERRRRAAAPFEDRRRRRKAPLHEQRRDDAALGGAAGVHRLGHRAEDLAHARRLRAGNAEAGATPSASRPSSLPPRRRRRRRHGAGDVPAGVVVPGVDRLARARQQTSMPSATAVRKSRPRRRLRLGRWRRRAGTVGAEGWSDGREVGVVVVVQVAR